MTVRLHSIECFKVPMQTRFPFRYGIASMTELPHLIVLATVECDGQISRGVSADGLPPKWFTKDLSTSFRDEDLPQMLAVIRHAADVALELKDQRNLFQWWWQLYHAQSDWAASNDVPPLLAGFGVSLIERAVIDAYCRRYQTTLFRAMRANQFGIELSAVRDTLGGLTPRNVLPASPRQSVRLRHTIGLSDPLTDTDIDPADRVDDGLPHSLAQNIRQYGLDHFKIKLQGNPEQDLDRLIRIVDTIGQTARSDVRITLDGNEQYSDMETFRDQWDRLCSDQVIGSFLRQTLLFVEQPLNRAEALSGSVRNVLDCWPDAPPIIIDESDADLECLPMALELGYAGTSHKNCKGIFKGLVNAATVRQRRDQGTACLLSAEDLANVGPVALLQDLAMTAALGVDHVERNGHHYFAGLSAFSRAAQRQTVTNHPDLYQFNDSGAAVLSPRDGRLSLRSVNSAPFGVAEVPISACTHRWDF